MKRWFWHRTRALLLALLLGLSMSLAVSHASVMAAKMAVAVEAAQPGVDSCDDCSGGDEVPTDLGTCLAVCGSAAQGLVPEGPAALPPLKRTDPPVAHLLAGGHTGHPDHGPPKALTLI
jgi:hypothetical protein